MEKRLNLVEAVRQHAIERGDANACVYHDEQRALTYADLDRESNKVANGLLAADLTGNQRMGILDRNSDDFAVAMLGIAKSDNPFMGINFHLAATEIKFILQDSQAPVLFVGEEYYAKVEQIEAELEHLVLIIALDGGHPRWPDYHTWKEGFSDTAPPVFRDSKSDIWQLYTSGTTGHPKGVRISKDSFSKAAGLMRNDWLELDPGQAQLICLPLMHNFGMFMLLLSLIQGSTSIITREWVPADILKCIEQHKIRFAGFVPVMIQNLVDASRDTGIRIGSFDRIVYGGAPISNELQTAAKKTFHCQLIQAYGMTENVGLSTRTPLDRDAEGSHPLMSVGKAYPGCELKIVAENGDELETGETGEILVRCPWLMEGYWNRPEATEETLKGGWLHTGDGGYVDENGYLFLRDRISDMIISGGENIYPAEVENVIGSHPAVVEAAVVGVPDERWGETATAVIVYKSGQVVSDMEIIDSLKANIAAFKVPKKIVATHTPLPRNATGKILRRVVRDEIKNK